MHIPSVAFYNKHVHIKKKTLLAGKIPCIPLFPIARNKCGYTKISLLDTCSKIHGLVASGGEDGAVECFDMRKKYSVGRINIPALSSEDYNQEVTSLRFDEDQGYLIAVGSSTGKVSIYDLRMSSPLRVKDHMYDSPILNIKWHQTLNSTEPKLITADKHIVRVWDPNTGNNMTSIEPDGGAINDVCIFQNSGLMLLALDNSQIPAHFIPALGPAPKWCSHLDNLTQRAEVAPVEYETLKEEIKKKKIEEQRKSRITQVVKIPKVNRNFTKDLVEEEMDPDMENADKASMKKRKKRLELSKAVYNDERFKEMFTNEDFEIDEQSREYLALHPQAAMKEPRLEEHFDSVSEDDQHTDGSVSDLSAKSDSDDDVPNSRRIRLYEVKDDRHAEAFLNSVSLANEDAQPIEERVAALDRQHNSNTLGKVKYGPGGSREISFFTKSSRRHREEAPNDEEPKDFKRRGVQCLGLKQGKAEYYMFGGNRGRGRGGRGRGGRGGRGRGRR
ncbi:hypothetical protein PR202_ga18303 [Eleusine coracana subsp. coracana]|uniref:NUC153 domain-containing protein n=1 Tax=Eleusine coracana subsp. coracana TaxID=191504 RepID=A0AAV5CSD7_ELECO|nr:hypothetical protein PR202_ga18303 [Eleusine coracana subsp. coracana]